MLDTAPNYLVIVPESLQHLEEQGPSFEFITCFMLPDSNFQKLGTFKCNSLFSGWLFHYKALLSVCSGLSSSCICVQVLIPNQSFHFNVVVFSFKK